MATWRLSFVSRRAVDLAHASGTDGGDHFIGAETRAGSEGQTAPDYTGEGRGTGLLLQNAVVLVIPGSAHGSASERVGTGSGRDPS